MMITLLYRVTRWFIRIFIPERMIEFNGSILFFGTKSIWRLGPKGPERITEDRDA